MYGTQNVCLLKPCYQCMHGKPNVCLLNSSPIACMYGKPMECFCVNVDTVDIEVIGYTVDVSALALHYKIYLGISKIQKCTCISRCTNIYISRCHSRETYSLILTCFRIEEEGKRIRKYGL